MYRMDVFFKNFNIDVGHSTRFKIYAVKIYVFCGKCVNKCLSEYMSVIYFKQLNNYNLENATNRT